MIPLPYWLYVVFTNRCALDFELNKNLIDEENTMLSFILSLCIAKEMIMNQHTLEVMSSSQYWQLVHTRDRETMKLIEL